MMMNFLYGKSFRLFIVITLLFVSFYSSHTSEVNAAESLISKEGRYVINLVSYLEPVEPAKLKSLKVFTQYRLYTTTHRERGKDWYRLRIGFFSDAKSAKEVLKRVRRQYPDAWVARVTAEEKLRSKRLRVRFASSVPVVKKRVSIVKPPVKKEVSKKQVAAVVTRSAKTGVSEELIGSIMESAQVAMTEGKYRLAAQLYTKSLQYKGHKYTREAHELLGLAYERSKRIAHAKAEYRTYLLLYKKGEGSERVRQRLAGLETARAKPRKKLRAKKKSKETYQMYGGFSQFFRRDESYTDLGGNELNASTVSNDFDLNIRKRTANYEMNAVLIAGYELDLFHSTESESRLSRLYVDLLDRRLHLSGRLGRQSSSTGGVLGRFDGALVSLQYFPRVKVNLVAGFPLDTSKINGIHTDKYFYGVSADIGTFDDKWDFNLFYINQQNAGVTDRRAVGGEVRYYEPGRSLFSLIDYDISYNDLNTLLLVGNWRLENKTMINTSFDYRKSPILSTENAFIGQTSVGSFSEMLDSFSEEEVRNLATDRTAASRTFMVGATRSLDKKFQLSGDFTVSEFSGTPASGGVAAGIGTGYDYFYTVQLVGSGLIKPSDTAIAGLKFSDTSTSHTVSLNLNTRYSIKRSLRINPRLRVDFSKVHASGARQFKMRPSLKTDWYWKRDFRFEFEGGMELAYEKVMNQTNKSTDYFLRMGYRAEF